MEDLTNREVMIFDLPTLEGIQIDSNTVSPLTGGAWYSAEQIGDGLTVHFESGALAKMNYLTADMILAGQNAVHFTVALYEDNTEREFTFTFSLLNGASARMRIPLTAVLQNRWAYEREGAWLKPCSSGDRVDLARVNRLRFFVSRKSEETAIWCMTAIIATPETPPILTKPVLLNGVLLDRFGQSASRSWEGKTDTLEDMVSRLNQQRETASSRTFPHSYDRWGGWTESQLEGTGFFRTYHDGHRWWLVTPDGSPFWSSGLDCVSPQINTAYSGLESALAWLPEQSGEFSTAFDEKHSQPSFSYLTANLIRAFGADAWYGQWQNIALGFMRSVGFNTVANWSDWRMAQKAGFPYVRPLYSYLQNTPLIFRDFPDVFAPQFESDAVLFAQTLQETRDDRAMIGYFLMNEPEWGFASENVASGMMFNSETAHSRQAFADFLGEKYQNEQCLREAWDMDITFEGITSGRWTEIPPLQVEADLEAFSTIMVDRFFGILTNACRGVDPHHLNLGARYYTIPPEWALHGMRHFDVFSVNCYDERVKPDLEIISQALQRPVLIGEWHFGALDVGLPASGIGRVQDQKARGAAVRVYIEDAAAKPWCIGVHYFTLYDQSALGRFDGENYNIGFLDTCHRPYQPLAKAARQTHERLYRVASGQVLPYDEAPIYLAKLFY